MFTLLEKLVQQQAAMQETLHLVLETVTKMATPAGRSGPTDLPEELSLPVTSMADLETIETALQSSTTFDGLVSFRLTANG